MGKAMVVAVGKNTVSGVIHEKTMVENQPTLLQEKLEDIAYQIGKVGFAAAFLTFGA